MANAGILKMTQVNGKGNQAQMRAHAEPVEAWSRRSIAGNKSPRCPESYPEG
jgi:hypothetical protein